MKKRILEALISKLEQDITACLQVAVAKVDDDGDDGDKAEGMTQVFNSRVLYRRVSKLQNEVNYLKLLELNATDEVKVGSIVELNNNTCYFILNADFFKNFETVSVDGFRCSTLTTKAPLYALIRGKKQGYVFNFNGSWFVISRVL